MIDIDPEAASKADQIFVTDLPHINTQPLADGRPIANRNGDHAASRRFHNAFDDALVDFHHLVDEIRFHTALAALVLHDFDAKRARGKVSPPVTESRLDIPLAALALLSSFMAPPPSPSKLFVEPYASISGHRILGLWFAGQLLDSAIIRSVSALDRLSILLWAHFGKARDNEREPAFRSEHLENMRPYYARSSSWNDLCNISGHPLFTYCLDWRNRHVHRARVPSQLNGMTSVARDDGREISRGTGIDPATHLAISLAFYNEILIPAVRLTGTVLGDVRAEVLPND